MVTTPDGRAIPPLQADERSTLEGWLEFHRDTLVLKCAGLEEHQLRLASVAPSTMTLLGLVRHMAEVERNWFQRVFAGLDVPRVDKEGEGDGFTLAPDGGLEEALDVWRTEIARGRELIAGSSLEDSGSLSREDAGQAGAQRVSLRWILIHMIEEYARHNGHADLLRESIDGATGA